MADIKTLESLMDKDTFFGEGNKNILMEVTAEYAPGKYTVEVSNPAFRGFASAKTELLFNPPYALTSFTASVLGLQHKLSASEMRALATQPDTAVLLWCDPRYVLKFSKDIKQLSTDVYSMKIDDTFARKAEKEALADAVFGQMSAYIFTAEMHFENDLIKKMTLRALKADGTVEQEDEIIFHK